MKKLYYKITGEEPLKEFKNRKAEGENSQEILEKLMTDTGASHYYGAAHWFTEFRILGLVFPSGINELPKGFVPLANAPDNVYRPDIGCPDGLVVGKQLKMMILDWPEKLWEACHVRTYTERNQTWYPTFGVYGNDNYILVDHAPDDATHKVVDGLTPLKTSEFHAMIGD